MKTKQVTFDGETKSIAEWARACGVAPNIFYKRIHRGASVVDILVWYNDRKLLTMNGKKKASEETKTPLQTAVETRATRKETASQKSQIDALVDHVRNLEKTIALVTNFKITPVEIETSASVDTESVAFAVLSDIHYELQIKPEVVLGLNEFNEKVANRRIADFFCNLVKLIKKEQVQTKIDTLCLAILGDLISNGILHDELMEMNWTQPAEAVVLVSDQIIAGIKYLVKNTNVKIDVVCHSGNHAKTTKKLHISTEYSNSFETIAYHMIAREFKDSKRVKFSIPRSYLSYYSVYNMVIAFHHGHHVKYGGGVGGLTIPMNKSISQWRKLRGVDYFVCGHFHDLHFMPDCVVNGSVCGYDPYALSIKASFQRPCQAFFLINKHYRAMTVRAPILFSV